MTRGRIHAETKVLGKLSVDLIAGPDAGSEDPICWILHGILGSGRNWRSFVRKTVAANPRWTFCLPDLRNHGRTGPLPGPHRLSDCVADLDSLPSPDRVIGHSFGGKVALAWAVERGSAEQVWTLDTIPFADDRGDSDVQKVIRILRSLPETAADRRDVRAALVAEGLSTMLVDWLLTSLIQTESGWRWVYDIEGVGDMLQDYFDRDFGSAVDGWIPPPRLHVVRALDSDRWTPEWVERLKRAPVEFHELPDAGHWLHVDNPDGLRRLLGF